MATRQKKMNLVSAKQNAPSVPGDTCPTINYVQEMIDQLIDRNKDDVWSLTQRDVKMLDGKKSESKYWYDQCKKVA